MKKSCKTLVLVCLLLMVAVSTIGCGGDKSGTAGKGEPVAGGTLRYSLPAEPRTFDPAKYKQAVENTVSVYMGANLLAIDPAGKLVGWLAKSYQVAPDGLKITLTLRDGVKFHSGNPLTAQVYRASFERLLNPETGSPVAAGLIQGITSIEAPDDKTLVLNLAKPNYSLLMNLASVSGYLQPVDIKELERLGDDYGTQFSGVGPYKMKEIKPGEYVTLTRNDDYNWAPEFVHQGPWYAQEITFTVLPEQNSEVAAFESGQLSSMTAPPQQWDTYADNPNYQFFERYTGNFTYLTLNLKNPIFAELKFRQALNHAVDRQAIVDGVYEGHAKVAGGAFPPSMPGQLTELDENLPYPHDTTKANQLLDELGWKDTNNDGIRERNGKPLHLKFYSLNSGNYALLAELVQAQLKQVGIDVEIVSIEASALIQSYSGTTWDFGLMLWSWSPEATDILYMTKHSSQVGAGLNFGKVNNPELDSLLIKARETMDDAEHLADLAEVQRIIVDQAYEVPLVYGITGYVYQANVNGVQPHPASIGFINDDIWLTPAAKK